jgi:4'-phosphopantetheinyl transferase EntD
MPYPMERLLTLATPAPGTRLGVAGLTAGVSEAQLLVRAPAWLAAALPAHLRHPQRRYEWLAGRLLALDLLAELGAPDLHIGSDEFGRPHLLATDGVRAGAISLSHGGGLVAAVVALGVGRRVGLDLEPERPKTLRLAPRWLTPDELAAVDGNPARASLAWSLKETLYKLYGRRQLDFRRDLRLDSDPSLATWATVTATSATGIATGRITSPTDSARSWTHTLHFLRPAPGCWLTYCVGAATVATPIPLSPIVPFFT